MCPRFRPPSGKLTNGEAIGDSGLRIAYAAWQNAVKASGQSELKLPGLDYTPDQLFFLAFGRCVDLPSTRPFW